MEEKITKLWVTYQVSNGGLEQDSIEVKGKVNHYTVEAEIKRGFSYYRQFESVTVIAWSVEDEFTSEEMDEFWKNH